MSATSEGTDEELAAAAKRGDTGAYESLVRRYLRPAMALAWQYSASLEDAEDVVQEAFHRAVRGLPQYDPGRPFGAWFFTIVRNAGLGAYEKASRRDRLAPITQGGSEENLGRATVFSPALRADLEAAIRSLAEMQRQCFCLCELEGFTSVEVARMLDITEGTVRTHVFRARHRLRRLLSEGTST